MRRSQHILVDLIVLIATTATGICRLARHVKTFGAAGQGLMVQFLMYTKNFLAFMGES